MNRIPAPWSIAAGNAFETHRDFSIAKVRDIFGDGIGETGIGLHAVEELGITVAIEGARLAAMSAAVCPSCHCRPSTTKSSLLPSVVIDVWVERVVTIGAAAQNAAALVTADNVGEGTQT